MPHDVMTKDDYLHWIATRDSDPGSWRFEDAAAAGRYVRRACAESLAQYLNKPPNVILFPKAVRKFITIMIHANWGSVEVDDFFTELNLYPEWLERKAEDESKSS